MINIAIRVDGLGKYYRIGRRENYKTLRDSLSYFFLAPFRQTTGDSRPSPVFSSSDYIWALRNVCLEIRRGEVVGVIGRNGAGKSTLLKILSRITEPTEGFAEIRGRVGSLLEVGTGFHPELTGRENVYLSGAILGMKRAEIDRKFDEIVAFSGIEKFTDTPVKHYSSGMYTRLAFSVAAHLETEILLVDEVLAVGDAVFQLKCLNKMSEVAGGGKTILFVSHNLEAVTKLCGRAILLEEGRVTAICAPQECVDRYLLNHHFRKASDGAGVLLRGHPGKSCRNDGPVQLLEVQVLDDRGGAMWTVPSGGPFTAVLSYKITDRARGQNVTFAITFSNLHNHRIASCRSHDTYLGPIRVEESGRVMCRIPRLPLAPGTYKLSIGCNTEAGFSDGVDDAVTIDVVGGGFYPSGSVPNRAHGEVLFDHEWEVLDRSKL